MGSRLISRGWLQANTRADARRVIIYGAGESGRQLLNALNHGTDYRVVAFIDDNPNLHETVINGRPVLGADDLTSLVEEHAVRQVVAGNSLGVSRAPSCHHQLAGRFACQSANHP